MDDRVSGVGGFIFFISLSKPTSGFHSSCSEVKCLKDEPDKSLPSTSMVSNVREFVSIPLCFLNQVFKQKAQQRIYNDVNNQQDATTFSFINIFKSALHVWGDKFAHLQEHF